MVLAISEGLIITLVILGTILYIAFILGIVYYSKKVKDKKALRTQHLLSDYDLIHLIADEPDNMMTVKRLTKKSQLNRRQAKRRLKYFYMSGLLVLFQDATFARHYSLKNPLNGSWQPDLSDKPFLTVEDILLLFKHYDYKLTLQDVCLSTKLPLAIVKREFDYFIKEKIIQKVKPFGKTMAVTHQYLLCEPYRSNPTTFLNKGEVLNLELERLYQEEWLV